MRSSIFVVPGFPTRVAKSSNVIWVGLPSRMRTIVPPGSVGSLMAAASRFAMPSNIAVTGARTACSSGVEACNEPTRNVATIAVEIDKTKRSLRGFMAPDSNPGPGGVAVLILEGEVFYFVAGVHVVSFEVLEMQFNSNTKLPKTRSPRH